MNIIKVSNSLDPDQFRYFVGPDLDPSCLQILLAGHTRDGQVESFQGENNFSPLRFFLIL